jgi:hypothetical protein
LHGSVSKTWIDVGYGQGKIDVGYGQGKCFFFGHEAINESCVSSGHMVGFQLDCCNTFAPPVELSWL